MDLDSEFLQKEIISAKKIQELLHEHPEAAYHETFTTGKIREKAVRQHWV